MRPTAKKRRKLASPTEAADSFVYRGVRIMRTWTGSKRRKQIGEAIEKVIERGPAENLAG